MDKAPSSSSTDRFAFPLGIDVGKTALELALCNREDVAARTTVSNDPEGHDNLVGWLEGRGLGPEKIGVCMEASGDFEKAVARELGIHTSMIRRWKEQPGENGDRAFPGNGNPRDEEMAKLRRELKRVKEENAILKRPSVSSQRALSEIPVHGRASRTILCRGHGSRSRGVKVGTTVGATEESAVAVGKTEGSSWR
jgi:transposase-like protein